jgi:hypothetical protein
MGGKKPVSSCSSAKKSNTIIATLQLQRRAVGQAATQTVSTPWRDQTVRAAVGVMRVCRPKRAARSGGAKTAGWANMRKGGAGTYKRFHKVSLKHVCHVICCSCSCEIFVIFTENIHMETSKYILKGSIKYLGTNFSAFM